MNERQRELWQRMILLIDMYANGVMDLRTLVETLEQQLDAAAFHDQALIKQWCDYWEPLQVYAVLAADEQNQVRHEDILRDINAMRAFLLRQTAASVYDRSGGACNKR